jgi:hypothetical protein
MHCLGTNLVEISLNIVSQDKSKNDCDQLEKEDDEAHQTKPEK